VGTSGERGPWTAWRREQILEEHVTQAGPTDDDSLAPPGSATPTQASWAAAGNERTRTWAAGTAEHGTDPGFHGRDGTLKARP
jgi:hypothetical protein